MKTMKEVYKLVKGYERALDNTLHKGILTKEGYIHYLAIYLDKRLMRFTTFA